MDDDVMDVRADDDESHATTTTTITTEEGDVITVTPTTPREKKRAKTKELDTQRVLVRISWDSFGPCSPAQASL